MNEADAARCLDEFHTIWGNRYPAIKTLWANASNDELLAIEQLRSRLFTAIDAAGLLRPGGPARATLQATASSEPTPAVPETPTEPPRPLKELCAELDELVGLTAVKERTKLVPVASNPELGVAVVAIVADTAGAPLTPTLAAPVLADSDTIVTTSDAQLLGFPALNPRWRWCAIRSPSSPQRPESSGAG
jgi:hypothetical protein